MKSLKHSISFFVLFLYVVGIIQPLHGGQAVVKTVQMSIEKVDKEMSLLDQIVEQANIIVDGVDQKSRAQAKRELISLMKRKDLDAKIKDAINDDIEIIKKPKTKRALHAARTRLLNTYTKINSQANVVETIAQATAMVKNASPEKLEETIAQAKAKIEKAEEEQQSTMGRWYAKAKRMVTAPVDYVFGEESSYAKTAFYGAVGLAALAAGAYGMYQYNAGKEAELDRLMARQRGLEAEADNITEAKKDLVEKMKYWEQSRFTLDKEKGNYWRSQLELIKDGKREPLTEEELIQIRDFEREYENIRWNERNIEDTLKRQGWWESIRWD